MIDPASWFTWSGDRAENSGSKPSNTAVRSMAGVVRARGMTPPGGRGLPPRAAGEDGQEALAEQVLEVDGGQRGGGEVLRGVDAERDVGVVLLQGHGADLARPRHRRCGRCHRAAAPRRWRTRPRTRWPAWVFTSSSDEMTIDVMMTDTTVKTTTLTIVPGSPGSVVVGAHDPATRPSRTGESSRVDTERARRAVHRSARSRSATRPGSGPARPAPGSGADRRRQRAAVTATVASSAGDGTGRRVGGRVHDTRHRARPTR